ncbi:hypothetical protein GCM10022376_12780 [Yimella lutea]
MGGRKRLRITLNGNGLQPWDPFCVSEPATREISTDFLWIHVGSEPQIVRVKSYVLPDKASFSTTEAFNAAAGPNKWNRHQGFYVYRADRLIQWGGWSRLRTLDEHIKLARIAIDFKPALDPAFHINISKAVVVIPTEMREELSTIASRTVSAA